MTNKWLWLIQKMYIIMTRAPFPKIFSIYLEKCLGISGPLWSHQGDLCVECTQVRPISHAIREEFVRKTHQFFQTYHAVTWQPVWHEGNEWNTKISLRDIVFILLFGSLIWMNETVMRKCSFYFLLTLPPVNRKNTHFFMVGLDRGNLWMDFFFIINMWIWNC